MFATVYRPCQIMRKYQDDQNSVNCIKILEKAYLVYDSQRIRGDEETIPSWDM